MKKILIVEDNLTLRDDITELLLIENFDVISTHSGEEGINLAKSEMPTLILCDIMLPNKDGYQVCRTLKSDVATKDIPIILLTAKNDSKSIVNGFEVGAQDYITKPFEISELLARINTHINLKLQNEKLRQYAIELEKSNKELSIQKATIEAKNKAMANSLNYAKRIQQALLPDIEAFEEILPNSFIIFKPCEIVSGDFYWIKELKFTDENNIEQSRIITVAADCTGHGVPGAFLTILGVSILHELVVNKKIFSPAQLLSKLDNEINTLIADKSSNYKSHDGMDIAICSFDMNTMHLSYAGAKRPLYLVRNRELTIYKGSRSYIGANDLISKKDKKEFRNVDVDLHKKDMLYIFSDGFSDQFGGVKNKKFNMTRFRNLLLSIADKRMEIQSNILEDVLLSWKESMRQIDDILIIGIKI